MSILIIIFLFLISCQNDSTDNAFQSLTVEIANVGDNADLDSLNFILQSIEKYNKDGNLVSKIEYYDNSKPEHEYTYEYNSNGLLKREIFKDNYGKGSLTKTEFKYNSHDSLIFKKITENEFTIKDSLIRDYDGKLQTQKTFIKGDSLVQFKTFKYNRDRQLIVVKRFNKDSLLLDSIGYVYNEKGFLSEEAIYRRHEFDIENYYNFHTYDSVGNPIISKLYFDNDSTYTRIDREFYSNGILKRIESSGFGYVKFNKTIKSFDNNGNLTSHKIVDSDRKIKVISNDYTYDSNGKWILKKLYFQNELKSITRRTFK